MGPAFRAYRGATQRAVFYARYYLMRTVAVIKGTHYLEMLLTAIRTGGLIHNQMTGITLIFPLVYRNIFQPPVFLGYLPLVLGPLHSNR